MDQFANLPWNAGPSLTRDSSTRANDFIDVSNPKHFPGPALEAFRPLLGKNRPLITPERFSSTGILIDTVRVLLGSSQPSVPQLVTPHGS